MTRAPQPVYEQPSSSRRSSVRPAPAPAPRPVVPPVQAPPRLTAEQELMMQMAETCCDEYGNPLTPRTHMAVLAFLAFDANMSGEVDVYEFHAALVCPYHCQCGKGGQRGAHAPPPPHTPGRGVCGGSVASRTEPKAWGVGGGGARGQRGVWGWGGGGYGMVWYGRPKGSYGTTDEAFAVLTCA